MFESKQGMDISVKTQFGLPKDIKSRFEETSYNGNSQGIDYAKMSKTFIARF
jgi:hypothetical protein